MMSDSAEQAAWATWLSVGRVSSEQVILHVIFKYESKNRCEAIKRILVLGFTMMGWSKIAGAAIFSRQLPA